MPAKKERKKQRLVLKCNFSRVLVAFREVRSASHKPVRAADLAGTHTEQVDSADSREAPPPPPPPPSLSAEAGGWPSSVPQRLVSVCVCV